MPESSAARGSATGDGHHSRRDYACESSQSGKRVFGNAAHAEVHVPASGLAGLVSAISFCPCEELALDCTCLKGYCQLAKWGPAGPRLARFACKRISRPLPLPAPSRRELERKKNKNTV
jgi:hypothetical protein